MKMFADDTKVWCRIKAETDSIILQEDLDRLHLSSNTWQLRFNADKCKVMHIGHSCGRYCMEQGPTRKELESIQEEERDLGVTITADLKSSSQCIKSAATARRVIGMVSRNFRDLDIDDFSLIQDLGLGHTSSYIQAWSPYFVKDIEVLERVQKAATNLVPQLRKCSYPARLKKISITSPKDERLMVEVYKLLTEKEQIDHKQFFRLAENQYGTRGHEKKLSKDR